jgi:hypothetical protein
MWEAGLALGLCAAFDRPGLPCSLEGDMRLSATLPAEPWGLDAYLGQCAELGGRLRGGLLTLEVDDTVELGAGGFFRRVLGAVLPPAAPRLKQLRVTAKSGLFPPGFSRHLAGPLEFPLLERLGFNGSNELGNRAIAGVDVAALCRMVAPRLECVALLAPLNGPFENIGVRLIYGPTVDHSCAESAVTALAVRWTPRQGGLTTIRVGCELPDEAGGVAVAQLLQAAGEGPADHVVVEWA